MAPLLASLRLIRHPFPITHIAVRLPLFATSQPRRHPSPTSPPVASLTRRQRHPPTTTPLAPTPASVAHLIRYQPYPSRLHQQASSSPPVANRATRRRPRQQSLSVPKVANHTTRSRPRHRPPTTPLVVVHNTLRQLHYACRPYDPSPTARPVVAFLQTRQPRLLSTT
jgi:hypothetical protein